MISYEEGVLAMEWLARAFGFQERIKMLDESGRLSHGEMSTGINGVIMLATPSGEYESPRHHREHCQQACAWQAVPWVIDGVLVYVDDADAHFVRAKLAGATILSELESGYPGRRYRAEDCEGHRWMFIERAKA
ncbi:MAG TPA: VOC family protein [Lacunisphaera sp.]